MLDFLKQEMNRTFTENGAVTLKTTASHCLDLFATIGAIRHNSKQDIVTRFMRAYAENKDLALKLLFYARDIRGGLGERRVFRVILNWLAENDTEAMRKNIAYIPEFGRFDDLLVLLDTSLKEDALKLIKDLLAEDMRALEAGEAISLLGKWLPSVNASANKTVRDAKIIARYLGMTDAEYRKTLTKLRGQIKIIENNLREKDYTFDYSKQPSKAMFKYRAAFMNNDKERYLEFLQSVMVGQTRLHTSTLAPYEIVEPLLFGRRGIDMLTDDEKEALNVTWSSLPDFGGDEDALAVIDTSGSMYGEYNPSPASVALSLGLYFAERNTGAFKGHFIEFSDIPRLIEIKGDTFVERLKYISSFSRIANTDVEAVFDLILNTAVKHRISQEELPSRLIFISDMEFDCCTENASLTNFENAKRKFENAGYKLPRVVFWDVASRNMQQPVSANERGVSLVSGCTPRIFSMVANGDLVNVTPMELMLEVLGRERYACITA